MAYLGGGEKRKDPGLENNGQKEGNAWSDEYSASLASTSSLYQLIKTGDDDDKKMTLLVCDLLSQLKPPSPSSLAPPSATAALCRPIKINNLLLFSPLSIFVLTFIIRFSDRFWEQQTSRGQKTENQIANVATCVPVRRI